MIKKFLLVKLLAIWLVAELFAQPLPKIGEQMPYFELNDVRYYNTGKVSLNDFKGKWLFLDFWFTGCTSCIQSFPKINALQEKFKDKAVFMLVGLNDAQHNKGIAELYEKFRLRQNLNIPSAYDSVLAEQWGIYAMPHVFIIDPEGRLHNISDGRDFTTANIEKLINGETVKMWTKRTDDEELPFDPKNLEEEKIFYQSVLTEWRDQKQKVFLGIEDAVNAMRKNRSFQLSMVPLKFLYRMAYAGRIPLDAPGDSLYGKIYPNPVLKIKDSAFFKYNFNSAEAKGLYNYSLMLPDAQVSTSRVMDILRNDLKNTFGYTAVVQEEEVPIIKLVIKDKKLADKLHAKKKGELQVKAGQDTSGGAAGFEAKNISIHLFLNYIMRYLWMGRPPYFDETGIEGDINIDFKAILTDWKDVVRELNRHGLDLVVGTRKMKCIVVSD